MEISQINTINPIPYLKKIQISTLKMNLIIS